MIRQTLTRTVDAVVVDSPSGTWYAVWNSTEGFDPFTSAIRAHNASEAEEVWEEHFPDRGSGESLVIIPATSLSISFNFNWPG